MTAPPINERGEQNMLIQQYTALQEEVAALRAQAVRYDSYVVSAVDPVTNTFSVTVLDELGFATTWSGLRSDEHFLPAVGDTVQLTLAGSQPVYLPKRVAAGAIDWNELAAPVVSDIDVILTTANGKNQITYSVNTPSGSGTRAGDIWWQRQPAQTGLALDTTRLPATAWVAPASSTTVSPTYPAGLAVGDQVYAFLVIKPDTATVATPSNWSLVGATGALGSGTQGAGTGAIKIHVYKRPATAGLTGTQAFTITGGSAPVAHMRGFRAPAAATSVVWSDSFSSFSRATAAADIDGTTAANIVGQAKDQYVIVTGTPDDEATQIIISAISQTGLVFGPTTQVPTGTVINAQGNDISAAAAETLVASGTGTAVAQVSGGVNTPETGGTLVLRVRAVGNLPASGTIIASWEWDGTAWQPRVFGDGVFDTISAARITTGTMSAATLVSVGPPTGEHTELGGLGLAYYGPIPNNTDLVQVARWGRTLGGISPTSGQQSYAVDEEGIASFTGLNVTTDPIFRGKTLTAIVDAASGGKVVARTEGWAAPGYTTTELGMIELACVTKPFHLYRIEAHGMLPDVAGADDQTIRYLARYTTNGAAPTISSTILATDAVVARYDAFPWENEVAHVVGHYAEGATGHTFRVGLSFANGTGSTSAGLYIDNSLAQRYFMITDMGLDPGSTGQVNNMGGTISGGTPATPPANPKTVGEDIFGSTWGKVFTGSGTQFIEGSNGAQGQSPYAPNGNMRTFLGFDSATIQAVLVGAEILYVRVYTYWNHWYWNNGGYPVYGVHANASIPAGPTGQYALSMAFTNWRVGISSGIWVDLPSSWWGGFANGDYKGIVMGPAPNSSFDYYGKFNGPGAWNGPLLAVGWRK